MAMNPAAMAAAIRQVTQGAGPHVNWMNKPIPSMCDILERIFNLAQAEWAREFLFFPNPHVDAGVLTSPLNLQYKVAGQIRQDVKAGRVGPYIRNSCIDRGANDTGSDRQFNCDWVIIPAFNFGQQGACYFMQKTHTGTTQDHNGAIQSALYRIITDDVTGEVLYVGDMPETDTFQVVHMVHLNGAYHQRSMCVFEGSVLRSALTADNGRISIPQVVKALVLYYHTRETRICITCGAHPSLCCNCPVSLRQSEHPNDLRFHAHNTRTHLGHYSGKQTVLYLKKGAVVSTDIEYTFHRTNTDTNLDTVLSLRRWAVRDRLGAAVQRAFGKYVQRPPISTVAFAATIMNVDKSFDEIVDVLAESDNPHLVAHRHYTRSLFGSSSSQVSAGLSDGSSWENSQGCRMVTDGDEMDISQSVVPEYNVNGPIAISNLGGNHCERSAQIQQMRLLHQTRNGAEEVRLAEQLAIAQQQVERERQVDQLRMLETQRRAVQQLQLAEQQELLQQRQFLEQQRELAYQQCLAKEQQQKRVAIEQQAVQHQHLTQQQALEHRDFVRQQRAIGQQQVAAQQLELCQVRQEVIQQRGGQLQDANITPAVQSMATNTSALGEALMQAFTECARRSLQSCTDGVEQRRLNSFLPGNGSHEIVNSQGALSHASNSVGFGKRPRSDVGYNVRYMPQAPRVLTGEQMGAPMGNPQVSGISRPQADVTASSGSAIYSRSTALRTTAGQSPMDGGTEVLPGGWHNGGVIGRAVGNGIAPSQPRRPAPTERRLLPRGPQPALQPPEDPKRKRELDMRIRKREAARRSDARRLARVQQLQVEKNELERTTDELRVKQAKLLEENAMLRRQVAALGTCVPSVYSRSVELP